MHMLVGIRLTMLIRKDYEGRLDLVLYPACPRRDSPRELILTTEK
jgi:hypothetical protein